MKEKSGCALAILILFFMVGVIPFAIGMFGYEIGKSHVEEDAIKAGVARYKVDGDRKITFEWVK